MTRRRHRVVEKEILDLSPLTLACHRMSFEKITEGFYSPQKVRRRLIIRLRQAGYRHVEIAASLGVSTTRSQQLFDDARRDAVRDLRDRESAREEDSFALAASVSRLKRLDLSSI